MDRYAVTLRNTRHTFVDLRDVMAKATPLRSGDCLAGLAAASDVERVAARTVLADVPLTRFLEEQLIPYESDEVTRLIVDSHDAAAFAPVKDFTVGQFREWLLAYETTTPILTALAPGLTPETVAAVSKVCRNQDLVLIASKCSVVTRFRDTIGLPGRLSTRVQPNHPTDDPKGIAVSILDGLLYGCGDATIGINPATDSVAGTCDLIKMVGELIERYEVPTQSCAATAGARPDVVVIIADGLSGLAAQQHAPPLLAALVPMLTAAGLRVGPIVTARYARVALQDDVGAAVGAKVAVILLGERPGLGTPDSLSAYLIFNPRRGATDADRNCVSNIRPAGLAMSVAAETIGYLITQSIDRQLSGVGLKDERGKSLSSVSRKGIPM